MGKVFFMDLLNYKFIAIVHLHFSVVEFVGRGIHSFLLMGLYSPQMSRTE
jgi:hypothetical protein